MMGYTYLIIELLALLSLIGPVVLLFMIIVSILKKKIKKALIQFGFLIASVLLFLFLIFSLDYIPKLYMNTKYSSENETKQVDAEVENTNLLNEESLDISLKMWTYNKESNSLHIEYETGLPDNTLVEIITNVFIPDSMGEEYVPLNHYTNHMYNRQGEARVEDGLLSFTFDDSDFNNLPLPNSMASSIIMVPVSKKKNSFIGDEISRKEDFDEKYPNSTTFSFIEPNNTNEFYLRFEDSFEINNAHTIEEVYDYYTEKVIPYKELEKNPSKYDGELVSFNGVVLQIQEDEEEDELGFSTTKTVLRLAVNDDPNQILYVTSQRWGGMDGVYKEDKITVYGESTGSTTYESVAGHRITIPSIDAHIYHK